MDTKDYKSVYKVKNRNRLSVTRKECQIKGAVPPYQTYQIYYFQIEENPGSQSYPLYGESVIDIEPHTSDITELEKIIHESGNYPNGIHLINIRLFEFGDVLHYLVVFKHNKINKTYVQLQGPISSIIPRYVNDQNNSVKGLEIGHPQSGYPPRAWKFCNIDFHDGIREVFTSEDYSKIAHSSGQNIYGIFVSDKASAIMVDETATWYYFRTASEEYKQMSLYDLNRDQRKAANITLLQAGAFLIVHGQLQVMDAAENAPVNIEQKIKAGIQKPVVFLEGATFHIKVETVSGDQKVYSIRHVVIEYTMNNPVDSVMPWDQAIPIVTDAQNRLQQAMTSPRAQQP